MSAADAVTLTGWGWMLAASGNSVGEGNAGSRPGQPTANDRYLDYDVGHEIFFDGVKWRDPLTGNLLDNLARLPSVNVPHASQCRPPLR